MNLGFSRRNVVRHAPSPSRRGAAKRRRLRFDCLEDRRMLSGGSLTTPGTTVTIDSSGHAVLYYVPPRGVAMDSAGDAVAAWTDQQSNGNWNLMFERYTNSSGTLTAQGAVTAASNVTAGNWDGGEVIMVARAPTTGDFVVVWGTATSATKKDPSGTYATHAQLYSATGTTIGSTLLVGGSSSNLPKSVSMNDTGFDVLYGALPKQAGGYTLKVQRYSYTSSSDAAVGSPISVATPAKDDGGNGYTSMAMDGNGNFVVAWLDAINNNTTNMSIIDAELFTSAGAGQGVIQVANGGNDISGGSSGVSYGDVAMDSAGNFVVDWMYNAGNGTPWSVQARQFDTGGIPVQAETNPIIVAPTANWIDGLAELPDGNAEGNGAFDVAWGTNTSPINIDAATYNSAGTQTQFLAVTNNAVGSADGGSAAVDGNGDLFIVYGYEGNLYGDFLLDPPAPAPTTSASTASSASGTASPSGSTTAATDAVFAAYAYPGDDDTLA